MNENMKSVEQWPTAGESNLNRRLWFLLAGFVIMLFAGSIYAWSVLKQPFSREFGWSAGDLGLNFTVLMCCFCIGGVIGSLIQKKLGFHWTVIGSALLAGIGYFMVSRLRSGGVVSLYIAYGGLCGLGIGAVYSLVISCVIGWFPDHRAGASGVLMMGFGASSLLVGSAARILFSSIGWRSFFGYLAASTAGVIAICAIIIRPVSISAGKNTVDSAQGDELSVSETLKKASFWLFYVFSILIACVGNSVISFAKDFSVFSGAPESFAVALAGMLAVSNGFGRILSGILYDKLGKKKTLPLAATICVIANGICLWSAWTRNMALNSLGLILVGISYGFMPPLTSGFIAQTYGKKNFATNFSIVNTMLLFASSMATVTGKILDRSGSYPMVFTLLLASSLLGLLTSFFINKIGDK